MKIRSGISPQTKTKVAKMIAAGKTGAEIAKTLGISLPAVQKIRRQLGGKKQATKAKPARSIEDDLYEHIQIVQGCCAEILAMLEADACGDVTGQNDPDGAVQMIYDNVEEMKVYWPRFIAGQ